MEMKKSGYPEELYTKLDAEKALKDIEKVAFLVKKLMDEVQK